MPEGKKERIRRLRRERNRRGKHRKGLLSRAAEHAKRIGKINAFIRKLLQPDVPPNNGGWHPGATRVQVHGGIGAPMNVPAKLVWHTTEGSSLPTYSGSHPHFTLNPATGQLYQHIPIKSMAMTLKNLSGGVETNRANAIQVELIGFARDTKTWPKGHYERIAMLARWIEKHGGVKRQCSVTFRSTSSVKVPDWYGYAGHIGHQHVPENDHWDPGEFRIGEVI